MKDKPGTLEDLYRKLNIHNPNIDIWNKQIGRGPSSERRGAGLQKVRAAHNSQTLCIKSCIFYTCYKFLLNVLHAEQWQALLDYWHTTERYFHKLQY